MESDPNYYIHFLQQLVCRTHCVQLRILYIPHNCIRAEILFIWPHDAMMGWTNEAKIGFIHQLFKCTTTQIRLYIKNPAYAAAGQNIHSKIIQWDSANNFINC